MAAVIFTVDGVNLAFGLEWRKLSGEGDEHREILYLAEEADAQKLVRMAQEEQQQVLVGLYAVGDGAKKLQGHVYSAAALFGMTQADRRNALMMIKLDEELYSVMATHDGMPVPGFDAVGSRDAMRERALDYIGTQANASLVIFADGDYISVRIEKIAYDVHQLAITPAKEARLKPLPRRINKTVVFGILMIGCLYGYGEWMDIKAEQKRQAALAAQRQQADPEVVYRQNLIKELASSGSRMNERVPEVMRVVGRFPIEQGGWELQTMKCDPNTCAAIWEKKVVGVTYSDFLSRHARKGALNYPIDGKTITEEVPVERQSRTVSSDEVMSVSRDLPERLSQLQALGPAEIRYQMAPPVIVGVSQGGVIATALKAPVKGGSITVSGPIGAIDALSELHGAFSATNVAINIPNKTFSVEGKYYVKEN